MRELGENSTALHASVGKAVAEKEIDFLVGVGEGGRFIVQGAVNAGMDERNTYLYTDPDDFDKIAELLHNSLRPDDVLLVKASRGLRTERIIEAFKGLIK
jgi:UDP-N-acetylmuramoyl-tripeptide--D-alanyl-D-alanine ligase